jgi:hypothetical protein
LFVVQAAQNSPYFAFCVSRSTRLAGTASAQNYLANSRSLKADNLFSVAKERTPTTTRRAQQEAARRDVSKFEWPVPQLFLAGRRISTGVKLSHSGEL